MILFLSTGFSISTLPFTNSKCAGEAFGFNYFSKLPKSACKNFFMHTVLCSRQRSFFVFHNEDDNRPHCVNTQMSLQSRRDSLECADSSALWSATRKAVTSYRTPNFLYPLGARASLPAFFAAPQVLTCATSTQPLDLFVGQVQ